MYICLTLYWINLLTFICLSILLISAVIWMPPHHEASTFSHQQSIQFSHEVLTVQLGIIRLVVGLGPWLCLHWPRDM